MEIVNEMPCLDYASLTRDEGDGFTFELCHLLPVGIADDNMEAKSTGTFHLIDDLRLNIDHRLMVLNIEIGGIDVDARGAEVRIERQCLVELASNVQVDILRQSAIVGIEVFVVPLVAAVQHAVAVSPRVVAAHRQHVFTFTNIGRQVKAEGHHAIIRESHLLTVEPDIGTLTGTLELDEHLPRHVSLRKRERLAIPADGVRQIHNVLAESLIAVEGIGQGYPLPLAIIELRLFSFSHVAHLQPPAAVEIEFLTFYRLYTNGEYQHQNKKCPFHTLLII